MKNQIIQWYPGHIAKAEKQLKNNLDKVDLIIEVRDARIPLSTAHPHLNKWINGKKHLLVINRRDMITPEALKGILGPFINFSSFVPMTDNSV